MENNFNTLSEIDMNDYKWMPSLGMIFNRRRRFMNDEPGANLPIMIDYLKNGFIDLDQLEEYISIVMDVHKKVDGKDFHDVYKM
jgi:hypothetical protein